MNDFKDLFIFSTVASEWNFPCGLPRRRVGRAACLEEMVSIWVSY